MRLRPLPLAVMVIAVSLAASCSGQPPRAATPTAAARTPTPTAPTATPPPTTPTAVPTATPRPPAYAPDGRTGIPEVDALIEVLLTASADSLVARFPGVAARRGPDPTAIPVERWAADFTAAGPATLYAVVDDSRSGIVPYRTHDIAVTIGSGADRRGWRFALDHGSLVDVYESDDQYVNALVPDPARAYDAFLVLPPRDELPSPPSFHPLDTRTGDAGVDAVLALVQARDVDGLVRRSRLDGGDFPAEQCLRREQTWDARQLRDWLGHLASSAVGIRAIAVAPEGYRPASGDLVIFVVQTAPLDWSLESILVSAGEIRAASADCAPNPPLAILVPEPPAGEAPAPGRRTGVDVIDRVLDAIAAGDAAALAPLVDYHEVGCVAQPAGIGSPPTCDPGEAAGTPVSVITGASCEGYPIRQRDIGETLASLASAGGTLYAAWDLGPIPEHQLGANGSVEVVLSRPGQGGRGLAGVALWFSDRGFNSIWYGCGPYPPHALLGSGYAPTYVLAPPG
jgi:hypothetical protein